MKWELQNANCTAIHILDQILTMSTLAFHTFHNVQNLSKMGKDMKCVNNAVWGNKPYFVLFYSGCFILNLDIKYTFLSLW